MAKVDPRAELAAKLATILRDLRDRGDSYPPTAGKLRELSDPAISDEEFFKALSHESLVIAAKKDLSSPVALAEDAPQLAASDALLNYALGRLASAEKPMHALAKIASRVEKTLQPAFESALNERLSSNNLPAGVGRLDVKEVPHLYLTQFPPPAPKTSPVRELLEQMAAALRARRERGESVVALSELHHAETEPGLVKKALRDESFASNAVVVPVSKTVTLLGSPDAREALFESDRLLTALLEANTSPKKPLITPDNLAAALPEEHRPAFTQALQKRMQSEPPAAGVLKRTEDEQVVLCLERHLPATLLLGEKVVTGLQRRRTAGQDYPVSLKKLVDSDAPGTTPELIEQLVNDKSFRGKVILAVPGRADSPVALPGDEERLASSPLVLTHAVGLLSTPEQPLHPLKKIIAKIAEPMRSLFEQAMTKHVAEKTLPAALAAHDVGGQVHLRRADYPLPPPADEALANRLLTTLKQNQRTGVYPVSVRELMARIAPEATDKLTKAALAHNVFRSSVIVARPGDLDAPAALREDCAKLAADPRLLEYALTKAHTPDNMAIPIPDLCKSLAEDLRPDFTIAVNQVLADASLPATVGCLLIKKKPYLFLKSDLAPRPIIVPAAAVEEPTTEEPDEVPARDTFAGEMTRLEEGREAREEKPSAPAEQGDLFATTTKDK
jgi:hypothetical protein